MEICVCRNCGKKFIGRTAKQCFYCSNECKQEYKDSHKKEYEHKCDYCGKIFFNTKKTYNSSHCFCSRECYNDFTKELKNEIRQCEICGKEFKCLKSSTKRFCSNECQSKWQSIYRTGENSSTYNKSITTKDRTIKCEWCGKEFIVGAYKIDKSKFCSKKCRREWYAKVWSQDLKWKEESRIRAVNILEQGLISKVETAPQRQITSLLKKKNIHFVSEKNCKYYSLDIYLNEYNLGIEIMGTFWHCDARNYEAVKYKQQYNRIISDKRKRTYLKKYCNIPVLYIWENDSQNLDLCFKLIQLYINNKGKLLNYHSFNYHIEDDKILLNKEILKPYMELPPKKIIKNFIK